MDLKELLGEDLYTQVAEKIGDKKIAVVSDGSYIPKSKFDDKLEEIKDLKEEIKTRDTQLTDLQTKANGNEKLQAEITSLQQENENIRTESEQKLQQREFDFALESALRDAKARNPKAVKALLNNDSIKIVDGQLTGLEEQMKALRESDDYLFVPDGLKGKTPPGTPPNPNGYDKPNPFSRDTLNLTEQGVLWRENPELAKQLQAQAKK